MDVTAAISASFGKGLTNDQVARVAELAQVKEFMGGDTIVRQFDGSSDLVLILEGAARVNTFQGEEIAVLGSGSVVGEISLIDDQPRSATVASVHGTKVAIIPSGELRKLMASDSSLEAGILRNICVTLCTRLRHVTIHLDGLMVRK
ncbi:MAG: cyclic nucleotide-binding domain-containing protein [Fimbriimonadales bacterium]|nr:cyclic nucleotide-binding domain-containing protein [Fimbriimonadales bacterium]